LLSNSDSNKVLRVVVLSDRQQVLDRPREAAPPPGRIGRRPQLRGAVLGLARVVMAAAGVVTS
jgi:hypothetical protein